LAEDIYSFLNQQSDTGHNRYAFASGVIVSQQLFQRWLYIILIVSALIRFGFLVFGEVLPVMWDARRYAAAGLGLISYIDNSGAAQVTDDNADQNQFKRYYDKYIQGEEIEWLAYSPHSLTEARDELFFSGPLYPAALAVIFALSPVADFDIARTFGILMDLLSNLLVILIAVRLIGRTPALIAGAIYALYFPFTLASTMLLLETPTSCLLLATIYMLIRGSETDNRKHYIVAGILTGLMMLVKPTALLLGVPLLAAYYIFTRTRWSFGFQLRRMLYYAVPAIVILVGWTTVTSAKYGQLALRDPNYSEANLRQSSSIIFEGYDLDKVEKDFWTYSIGEQILDDPAGYVGLVVKKFERLWSRPFNDFKKSFLLPYQANEIFHSLIIFLGLLGLLILVVSNFGHAAWVLLIAGYYTAIHVIFHSICRYSFNAMPLLIIAAGLAIWLIVNAARGDRRRTVWLAIGLILVGWIVDPRWTALIGEGLTRGLVMTVFDLRLLLVGLGLLMLARSILPEPATVARWWVPVLTTVVFAVVGWSSTLARDEWAEFSCRLDDPNVKAGTRLYISELREVADGEVLAAVIDVNSGQGRQNSFTISVAGHEQEYVGGQPPLRDLFYPKPTYRFYASYIPLGIEEFRQYAIIPLDVTALRTRLSATGFVDMTVAINQQFREENNFVLLWGNYPTGRDKPFIPGVRFTSIERYVHKDDPRIRYPKTFLSDSTISYYIDRNSNVIPEPTDLSPARGLQTGRYNIFLIHFRQDGSFLVY